MGNEREADRNAVPAPGETDPTRREFLKSAAATLSALSFVGLNLSCGKDEEGCASDADCPEGEFCTPNETGISQCCPTCTGGSTSSSCSDCTGTSTSTTSCTACSGGSTAATSCTTCSGGSTSSGCTGCGSTCSSSCQNDCHRSCSGTCSGGCKNMTN